MLSSVPSLFLFIKAASLSERHVHFDHQCVCSKFCFQSNCCIAIHTRGKNIHLLFFLKKEEEFYYSLCFHWKSRLQFIWFVPPNLVPFSLPVGMLNSQRWGKNVSYSWISISTRNFLYFQVLGVCMWQDKHSYSVEW